MMQSRTIIGLMALTSVILWVGMTGNAAAGPRPVSVRASSVQDAGSPPEMVIDQNMGTRWSSRFNDEEWIELDLGSVQEIVGVVLFWEAAFGRKYEIQISTDKTQWQTAYRTAEGDGQADDIYFGRRPARFIKLAGQKRGSPWGYSLWEVNVKGPEEEIKISASSSDAAHGPAMAMDANPATDWHSENVPEASLDIQMPRESVIGEMDIEWGDDGSGWYRVRTSKDGKEWTPVYQEKKGDGGRDKIRLNMVSPKFIQIQMRSPSRSAGFAVREVRFKTWEERARQGGLGRARGMTGWVGGQWSTFVGQDGTFGPEPHPHQISFWVFDHRSKTLYTPETLNTTWEILDGRQPINISSWSFFDIRVTTTVFTRSIPEKNRWLTFARTSVENLGDQARDLSVYAVIRPNPLPKMKGGPGVREISYDGKSTLRVNGMPGLILLKVAAAADIQRADDGAVQKFDRVQTMDSKTRVVDAGGNGGGALPYRLNLPPKGVEHIDVVVPSGPNESIPLTELAWEPNFQATREFWKNLVPIQIQLPDRRYSDAFYSSIHYLLTMMKGTEPHPGPYGYNCFFLHDAVDMVVAFDKAGLHKNAADALPHFNYNETDNYLDGLPATIFTLFEHYRLTGDRNFLAGAYPKIKSYCELMKRLRARQLSNPAAVEYGLLPKSASQDNFTMHSYLYYDNWYGIVGYKSALDAATVLNKGEDIPWMREEYDALLKAVTESIRKVMKRDNIDYIPSLADDYPPEIKNTIDEKYRIFGAAQMAWAQRPGLDPGRSLGIPMPVDLLRRSYERYWNNAGRFSGFDGGWYVEYEKFFWGYNVMLARPLQYVGLGDIALANIEWSLKNMSCPGGWMEAMPSRENENGLWEVDEGIVGDVPHGWVAAHYAVLLRDMLLREEEGRLVLLPNIPPAWVEAGQVIDIDRAPSYFGPVSFRVESEPGRTRVNLRGGSGFPDGFSVGLPGRRNIRAVDIDGRAGATVRDRQVLVPSGSREVLIHWDDP